MIWFNMLSKLVKAIRSGESPGQIAAGFTVGFSLGLMPLFSLQGLLLVLILILLNINIAAGMLAMIVASILVWLIDPWIHSLGLYVLTQVPALQGFWETLYNMPVAPLTQFYNTVVSDIWCFPRRKTPLNRVHNLSRQSRSTQ